MKENLVLAPELLQPSIEILGVRIDEPVTTLTDLFVSAVCLYAFFQLKKFKVDHRIYIFFRGYFLLMALSTFIGGIVGHGFLYALAPQWKFLGWGVSMLAINLMERAMISYSSPFLPPKVSSFFSVFNIVELIIFAILAFTTLRFRFVEIHTAYGLTVFVFGFNMYHYFVRKDKSKMIVYFIWAVVFAAVASVFFLSKTGFSKWFNHADISHIFLCVSAYMFYRGAKRMLADKKKEYRSTSASFRK